MSKHDQLTAEEVNSRNVQHIEKWIMDYASATGKSKEEINILDYGSGRGRTVAALRKLGYNAYGVEIDPLPFNNGLGYFKSVGLNSDEILQLIDDSCITKFDDNFFDLVLSEQVFEHVQNLEIVASEIGRITKKGGIHKHVFPAKYHFKEQHVYMPLVHWLPKNKLRLLATRFYVSLKVDPNWERLKSSSNKEKAQEYYNYLNKYTYYRPIKQICSIFEKNNFSTDYDRTHSYSRNLFERAMNKVFATEIKLYLTKK